MVISSSAAGAVRSGLKVNLGIAAIFFKWNKFIHKMNLIHFVVTCEP